MRTPPLFLQSSQSNITRRGKIGWLALWLLGIPIPILIVLFLLRGCT